MVTDCNLKLQYIIFVSYCADYVYEIKIDDRAVECISDSVYACCLSHMHLTRISVIQKILLMYQFRNDKIMLKN